MGEAHRRKLAGTNPQQTVSSMPVGERNSDDDPILTDELVDEDDGEAAVTATAGSKLIALLDLTGLTAADAEVFGGLAAVHREGADACADTATRAQYLAEAAGLDALAAQLRDPAAHGVPILRLGQGGETAPPDHPDMQRRHRHVAQAVGASPGMLAADASLVRLGLARDANVLTMAVETAKDAGAETAAEKMIAHQLAAAHPLLMELLMIAAAEAQKHRQTSSSNALTEAARTATAAARLMDSCARSTLILDRLRNGARQVVTVQHIDQRVAVAAGGQAVVAGSVASGDRAPASPCPRGRKSE